MECGEQQAGTSRKGKGWRTCERCGKWFYDKPSHNRKHCSLACRRAERVTVECPVCHRPFSCTPYTATRRVTCSDACSFKHQSMVMRGHKFKDSVSKSGYKKRAQSQTKNRCAICGYDRARCDVCHVIPSCSSDCHELWNLIRMCPNHHRMYDNKKLEDHPVIVAARREAWRQYSAWNVEQLSAQNDQITESSVRANAPTNT